MKTLKKFNDIFSELSKLMPLSQWAKRFELEEKLAKIDKATRCYSINCTGDAVTGDAVLFIKRIWDRVKVNHFGKLANAVTKYELTEGIIIKDSYGREKQQHTFTIKLKGGEKMLIKGRNLYAVAVWRKPWKDESARDEALTDKHIRGNEAREARYERKYCDFACYE